ncbi:MAG: TdeIII family type II restriction endonuclease [Chloroflexota bacterium]
MGLTQEQGDHITNLLCEQIDRKLAAHSPESVNMPFHVRLLGKDRMAIFSFIQSINTMLGTSVFEQVAVITALPHFKKVVRQSEHLEGRISSKAQILIQEIIDDIKTTQSIPDKSAEIRRIMQISSHGEIKNIKKPRFDLFLLSHDGHEYYFEIKSAKPNVSQIAEFKRMLLEWVAVRSTAQPTLEPDQIHTVLAIPYNPYEPNPYNRWTFRGMFDFPHELMVAEEFWNFLGGDGAYSDILNAFEQAGIRMRSEIDAKFSTFL